MHSAEAPLVHMRCALYFTTVGVAVISLPIYSSLAEVSLYIEHDQSARSANSHF